MRALPSRHVLGCAFFIVAVLALLAVPVHAQEFDDDDCLSCHEGEDEEAGEIDPDPYYESVHADESCVGCHVDATDEHDENEEPLAKVDCADCHDQEVEDYHTGMHGELLLEEDDDAPDCAFCHGTHDILPQTDDRSRTFPLNVPELCGECHRHGERSAVREAASQTHILEAYGDSIHGKGLIKSGLVVSATCSSCHTAHRELPAKDSRSSVHPDNIVSTCGECHYGIAKKLRGSVHSPAVNGTEDKLPGCNDCHTSHSIRRVEWTEFRFEIVAQCGNCHEELETYFDTYHGKASKLGGVRTARCYDCHGSHEILPPSDPASTLSESNIVATCASCHRGSNANFVQYMPHATHDDRERFPELYYSFWIMTTLLVGTIGFFGLHTILWLIRSLIASRRREEDEVADDAVGDASRYYRRFEPAQSVLHLMVIVSFLTLAFTGMALKYPDTAFFVKATRFLGGPVVTGFIHRLCALITFAYFGAHLWMVAGKLRRREITLRGLLSEEYSLVPLWRDARDMGRNFLWFFGLGPRPRFGRWTYWEKFDYMAVFWGVAIIGLTGLLMWFPEQATLLVPGWVINVALVIHSDEALLAAAFIFTVHFFNTHFRPGKFPMDPVIFTGRVPLATFREEHPREYDRLVASGELESHLVGPPPRWLSVCAYAFGLSALMMGLTIIAAIVYSIIFR